jgi:hypothetical protein
MTAHLPSPLIQRIAASAKDGDLHPSDADPDLCGEDDDPGRPCGYSAPSDAVWTPQPNAGTADPIVAVALATASRAEVAPSPLQPPPDVLTTRITATAFGPGNASATRFTIVRLGAALPSGYQVLAWVVAREP